MMDCPAAYVAVPDASTFSDRLFRWIYGGDSGHINPFHSAEGLAADNGGKDDIRLRISGKF